MFTIFWNIPSSDSWLAPLAGMTSRMMSDSWVTSFPGMTSLLEFGMGRIPDSLCLQEWLQGWCRIPDSLCSREWLQGCCLIPSRSARGNDFSDVPVILACPESDRNHYLLDQSDSLLAALASLQEMNLLSEGRREWLSGSRSFQLCLNGWQVAQN